MVTIKQHLRQRLVLHTGHPSGALGPYPIVKEYDGNATVAFNGVKIGASGVSRPADPRVMSHWLNVKKWDVSLGFTGTTMGEDWPAGWSISPALEFQLATGRTATIAEAGDSVEFDSETPITRLELYKGAAGGDFQRTRILWEPSSESLGTDPVYTRAAGVDISIMHGAWGHHNIHGEWMLYLDVNAFESANESAVASEESHSSGGSGESPPEPTCSSGFAYRNDSLVWDGVGTWYWYCDAPPVNQTHEHRFRTDPDAAVDAGDFFTEPIFCRNSVRMDADYSISPVLEVTIEPAEYYDAWG